ncbi:MAG: hypothetical protein ACLR1T_00800 [Evtepia gabavorous]
MARLSVRWSQAPSRAPPPPAGQRRAGPQRQRPGDQLCHHPGGDSRNLNEDQKEALRKFAEAMGELPASSSAGESGERSVFHRRKKK